MVAAITRVRSFLSKRGEDGPTDAFRGSQKAHSGGERGRRIRREARGIRCCSPISLSSYIFFYSPPSYFTRFYFAQLVVIDNAYQRPNLSDIATALYEDAMTRHDASAPTVRPPTLHNTNTPTQLFHSSNVLPAPLRRRAAPSAWGEQSSIN